MPDLDVLALARDLIRCPSVTPADAGALEVVERTLQPLGFTCVRLRFAEPGTAPVDNLYARLGTAAPVFCFAGHTDVVPPGDRAGWSADPFGAEVIDGMLYGRGAADMKTGVAAFLAATVRYLDRHGPPTGSIAVLITGDEEGPSVNGTRKVLDWLTERGERLDACLVGEPTGIERLGDTIKIGRRGSLTGTLTVTGAQGHTAYPHLADNPLPRLVRTLAVLADATLDQGTSHFQPSTLTLTTIDVGNPASNVIPAQGRAVFNIRFNDRHTPQSLETWLRGVCAAHAGPHRLDLVVGAEPFLTAPGPLSALVTAAVERVTGRRPDLSTTGGTSDARFLRCACPVVELGLVGRTMHKTDESVPVADLLGLVDLYAAVLEDYFGTSSPLAP